MQKGKKGKKEKVKKKQKCPNCGSKAIKRISVGIWRCKKCNSKFTGKAYKI